MLNDKTDIKILLLAILRRLPSAIAPETLAGLAAECDGTVTYFDVMECLAELLTTEHAARDGDAFAITEKGARNGEIIETTLPRSIRSHVERVTFAAREQLARDMLINADYTEREGGGYTVLCRLSDGVSEVLRLELFAVDVFQARELKSGFRRNAVNVYIATLNATLANEP
ncbi:MAG: DUF4364 family protein [Oscillospiraceae bacterium]|jgi:hypothetical protein|nr:DUF4364 family protein [Oscillospiraceae bacterium]